MMPSDKLPVVTVRLKKGKKPGMYLMLLLSLLVGSFMYKMVGTLDYGEGRFMALLLCMSSVVFCVLGLVGLVRLTRDGFVGMFISEEGMNDISTGHSYGMVQWKDVVSIRVMQDMEHPKHQYIVLNVKDPQMYVDRELNPSKKRSLTLKMHYYGSPICFSDRGLRCTFAELHHMILTYYENYKLQNVEC